MRIVIAAVVSAVVVFVWGFIAWPLAQIWSNQVRSLPEHGRVTAAIMEVVPESGAYVFPGMPDAMRQGSPEERTAAFEAWAEEHRAGPVGIILVNREGWEPMSPTTILGGFVLNLFNSLLLASLVAIVARAGAGFRLRFGAAMVAVVFASISTHASNCVWFHFPTDFTVVMVADHLIAWTLGSAAIALIVVNTRSVVRVVP